MNEGYKSKEWEVGENELLFSILRRINGHVCLPESVVTWILILFFSFKWKWNNPGTIHVFSSPCNVCFSFPAKGFHNLWLHSEAEVWIEKCWFCNFLRPASGAVTIQSKPVVGTSSLSSIVFLQRHFTPIPSPANCWQPIDWKNIETVFFLQKRFVQRRSKFDKYHCCYTNYLMPIDQGVLTR